MKMDSRVNISGHINSQTSYGLVTCNIIREFIKREYDVTLFPNGQLTVPDLAHLQYKQFDLAAPSLRIDHQFNMGQSVGSDRFGMTFFEVNRLTDLEVCHLNSLDHLFVPSEWAKDICQQHLSATEITVAPLAVDAEIFNNKGYLPNKCIFLSMGKWEKRKGQDEIVAAFRKAFTKNQAELWMFFDGARQDIVESKKKEYASSNVKCFNRLPTQHDVARIMNSVTCFVSHSKAEGWNLELLEAMACGRQCISPCYSGESEFVSADNCHITDHNGLVWAEDGIYFGKGLVNTGEWCTPDEDSLIENMRLVHKNQEINQTGMQTANKFSWTNTFNQIERCLC
jgi:glycosyltransferase involved in cell wall biosynthesis